MIACRLSTLERVLCGVRRVGDVPGLEIPGRYFQFLRTGDARPLEPVLEHNRLDLISLAAVTAHAVQLVEAGTPLCRDAAETLALGKVYERAGCTERAIDAYRRAAASPGAHVDVIAEAIYRLAARLRRDRRFAEAAECWRRLLDLKAGRTGRRSGKSDDKEGALLAACLMSAMVGALVAAVFGDYLDDEWLIWLCALIIAHNRLTAVPSAVLTEQRQRAFPPRQTTAAASASSRAG